MLRIFLETSLNDSKDFQDGQIWFKLDDTRTHAAKQSMEVVLVIPHPFPLACWISLRDGNLKCSARGVAIKSCLKVAVFDYRARTLEELKAAMREKIVTTSPNY